MSAAAFEPMHLRFRDPLFVATGAEGVRLWVGWIDGFVRDCGQGVVSQPPSDQVRVRTVHHPRTIRGLHRISQELPPRQELHLRS